MPPLTRLQRADAVRCVAEGTGTFAGTQAYRKVVGVQRSLMVSLLVKDAIVSSVHATD